MIIAALAMSLLMQQGSYCAQLIEGRYGPVEVPLDIDRTWEPLNPIVEIDSPEATVIPFISNHVLCIIMLDPKLPTTACMKSNPNP